MNDDQTTDGQDDFEETDGFEETPEGDSDDQGQRVVPDSETEWNIPVQRSS
jgi:hypothetical protein